MTVISHQHLRDIDGGGCAIFIVATKFEMKVKPILAALKLFPYLATIDLPSTGRIAEKRRLRRSRP